MITNGVGEFGEDDLCDDDRGHGKDDDACVDDYTGYGYDAYDDATMMLKVHLAGENDGDRGDYCCAAAGDGGDDDDHREHDDDTGQDYGERISVVLMIMVAMMILIMILMVLVIMVMIGMNQ